MSSRPSPPATRGVVLFLAAALVSVALSAPAFSQGYGGTISDILVRADSLLAQKRSNEAVVQYQEARTLCATPAEMVSAFQGEARALLQMKEPLAAAGLLEEAATKYPDDPRLADLLFLAGVARRQGGDPAAAVPLLSKALEHQPTADVLPGLKFELGRSLHMSGQPARAAEVLKDYETEFPDHALVPLALYTLGIAQHDSKALEESEKTYRHLIEKYPQAQASYEAFLDMGDLLAQLGKRAEAAEFFRRYANSMPTSPYAARAMERSADLTLLTSPREAALFYGVAQTKAQVNPPPPRAEFLVSGWLGTKLQIARALSNVWLMSAAGAVVLVIVAGIAFRMARRRRGGARPTADRPASV